MTVRSITPESNFSLPIRRENLKSSIETKVNSVSSKIFDEVSEQLNSYQLNPKISFSTSREEPITETNVPFDSSSEAAFSEEISLSDRLVSGEGELEESGNVSGEGYKNIEESKAKEPASKALSKLIKVIMRKSDEESTYQSFSDYHSSSESKKEEPAESSTEFSFGISVSAPESSIKFDSYEGERTVEEPLIPKTEYMHKLAEGSFKVVREGGTYETLPKSKYQKEEGTPKTFVAITAKNNPDAKRIMKEEAEVLLLLEQLVKQSDLKDVRQFFVKNYVIEEDTVIAKEANLGEAKNVLGLMSEQEKASVLLNVVKGLRFLHTNGIFHKDIAPRNIIVHYKREWIEPDSNAIGRIIGNDVIIKGKRIIKKGTVLEQRHIDRLQKYKVAKIKVFSKKVDSRGMLTDFGCADIKNVRKSGKHPLDVAAPEVLAGKSEANEETEAFSFGQTLADIYLHPDRDSDISKASPYATMIRERTKKRIEKYNSLAANNFKKAGQSALSREEYRELRKIDKKLADVIKGLMSYNPEERPDLSKAQDVLQSLSQKKKSI